MRTTTQKLIFVSWVGDSDLLAWAATELPWEDEKNLIPGNKQFKVLDALKGNAFRPEARLSLDEKQMRLRSALRWKSSVLVGLLEAVKVFPPSDITAVLLSNLAPEVMRGFSEWVNSRLGVKVRYTPFSFKSKNVAMSYEETYKWAELQTSNAGKTDRIWFNLTAGSGAMTTALVILGKLRYPEEGVARFVMVKNNALVDCPIPLNLIEIWNQRDSDLKKGLVEYTSIIGDSPGIVKARESAVTIANHPDNVLILGPNGAGKELIARLIHAQSGRKTDAFIPVNCALFSEDRLESELFGHVKGAYTDAKKERKGKARMADGGTLFLDEIGDCPLPVQAKLLRFLQPDANNRLLREITPMGADEPDPNKPEIRIIAATNKPLLRLVNEGRFREDLYYRIAEWTIVVPSLRERKEDIPKLVDKFLDDRVSGNIPRIKIDAKALRTLESFDWPGNVRQLKSIVGRSAVLAGAVGVISEKTVIEALAQDCQDTSLMETNESTLDGLLARVQRYWIEKALNETNGNRKEAARILGLMSGQTLSNRLAACRRMTSEPVLPESR